MRFAYALVLASFTSVIPLSTGATDVLCDAVKNPAMSAPTEIYAFFVDEDENGSLWHELQLDETYADKPLQHVVLIRGQLENYVFFANLAFLPISDERVTTSFLVESADISREYTIVATYADRVMPCIDPEANLLHIKLPPNNALH